MSAATVGVRYTPQQYLALERKAAYQSEYFDGTITPRAESSLPYILITENLCGASTS